MSDFFRFTCRALALLLAATTLSLAWGTPTHAADPGELEGTLTTSDGGPISGTLALYQWQAGEQYFDYQGEVTLEDEASPAAYSFAGLPAGQYFLEFSDDTSVYGQTYSGAATTPPESLGDPGVVQVGASGATVNLSLAARQQVFGTVVNASSAGIDHVYITASLQTPSGPAVHRRGRDRRRWRLRPVLATGHLRPRAVGHRRALPRNDGHRHRHAHDGDPGTDHHGSGPDVDPLRQGCGRGRQRHSRAPACACTS